MSLSAKKIIRQQVKLACELLERTLWEIPREELHHPLQGGRSATWHVMHCATWVSIVGEFYKDKFEPYVYATSLKPTHEPYISDVWRALRVSKNRALQYLDNSTEDDLTESIIPAFPVIKPSLIHSAGTIPPHSLVVKMTRPSPITRLELWTWLPHFLEFQRGFIAGQLQFNPHHRRIEEFL